MSSKLTADQLRNKDRYETNSLGLGINMKPGGCQRRMVKEFNESDPKENIYKMTPDDIDKILW